MSIYGKVHEITNQWLGLFENQGLMLQMRGTWICHLTCSDRTQSWVGKARGELFEPPDGDDDDEEDDDDDDDENSAERLPSIHLARERHSPGPLGYS